MCFESGGFVLVVTIFYYWLNKLYKIMVSQRSSVLRDMILAEEPDSTSIVSGESFVQILLPDIRADVAKHLLHFLYMDTLPASIATNPSLLRSLIRAAQSLRLARLQVVCEQLLAVRTFTDQFIAEPHDSAKAKPFIEMPPSTLARDMGGLLGDPLCCDVRFVSAESRGLSAHRCILEARCDYFRAMFRFHRDAQSAHADGVDVMVPDSFVGLLRLFLFLYSDTLPQGSDDTLLQDLLAADRLFCNRLRIYLVDYTVCVTYVCML